MAGEIEGRGIVDRERERLLCLEPAIERADEAAQEIVRPAVRQPVAHHRGQRLAQEDLAAPRALAPQAPRHQRQAEQGLQPRLAHPLQRGGDMRHGGGAGEPGIAGEQAVGNDPHRRRGRLRRHVLAPAAPAFHRPRRRAREDGDEPVDRGGREIGGDDPALVAPQSAVRGKQAPPDGPREQGLDHVGLHIIGGIVEQHPLHRLGIERDVDVVAEHLAAHVRQARTRAPTSRRPRSAPARRRSRARRERVPGCAAGAAGRSAQPSKPLRAAAARIRSSRPGARLSMRWR